MARRRVELHYGIERRFEIEMDGDRVIANPPAPQPNPRFRDALMAALRRPLDFPSVEQALVPGDRVTVALDRHTPESAGLVAGIWQAIAGRGVDPDRFVVIQPASRLPCEQPDPRQELPREIRDRVTWKLHDPTCRDACVYLASTASGERVHLAREVVEADFLMTVGPITYDPVIGYRGTNSVLYPGLSGHDAIARTHGQGHVEIGPDDVRPLRELIDEIGWLLGDPFTVQVIPAASHGIAHVLAGVCDSVFARGKKLLEENWFLQIDERPDVVIAGIDHETSPHAWESLGAAVATARSLVARGGRIVILSQLNTGLSQGLELIRRCESARDAIRPLRKQAPPDLVCATQLAGAADWARVYLLSGLPDDVVSGLFLTPVADETEVRRLLDDESRCLFLESAQFCGGRVRAA